MREIYYNSDITPKSVNEIKLLTLYYDKINIVSDVFYSPRFETINGEFAYAGVDDFPFVPKSFCDNNKLLIDEGIINITKRNEQTENPYGEKFSNKLQEIIVNEDDYIFPLHPEIPKNKIITEEVYEMMKNV